jgi:hypothetical protein
MSLLSRIREAFGGKPALRNKPGGMAWINSNVDGNDGTSILINRVVRTVRLKNGNHWEIDPPQPYTATRGVRYVVNGFVSTPGQRINAIAMADDCLTPIQGDVTDEEVRELYAPKPAEPEQLRSDLRQWAREEA